MPDIVRLPVTAKMKQPQPSQLLSRPAKKAMDISNQHKKILGGRRRQTTQGPQDLRNGTVVGPPGFFIAFYIFWTEPYRSLQTGIANRQTKRIFTKSPAKRPRKGSPSNRKPFGQYLPCPSQVPVETPCPQSFSRAELGADLFPQPPAPQKQAVVLQSLAQ